MDNLVKPMSDPFGGNDVQIICPFCGKEVLHDYQIEGGFDDFDWNPCGHVVFASSGGEEGLFDRQDYYINTGDRTLDTMISDDTDSALEILQHSLPEKTFESEGGSIARGMGPRGDGATYNVIFAT